MYYYGPFFSELMLNMFISEHYMIDNKHHVEFSNKMFYEIHIDNAKYEKNLFKS